MKIIITCLVLIVINLTSFAQEIIGQWNGLLKVQGIELRLVFNITKNETGYVSTMDSPDQDVKGLAVTTTSFENSTLKLNIANAGIEYEGILEKDSIIGNFKQHGHTIPLNLGKGAVEEVLRPQEPKKPYPYYTEEVTFENSKAKITLAGTLSLPKKEGKFPVVVMITGSGAENRDEELLGHKPFLVIADYLTKNGIGVLRYDDRGFGESTGNFSTATSVDFASDVESAITYLKTRKEIDKKKIGLIGHSEGGTIAPIVAVDSKDVSFIVLLAGPGIPGDQLLLLQEKLITKVGGASDEKIAQLVKMNKKVFDIIKMESNETKLNTDITNYVTKLINSDSTFKTPEGITKDQLIKKSIAQYTSPWLQYFIRYNPAPTLEKVKCAVLAVNGEKDLQVPPKENLTAIQNALTKGGNANFTTKEFPNLNHLFQTCETGSPVEYAKIEETFSPIVLAYITEWIKTQTK